MSSTSEVEVHAVPAVHVAKLTRRAPGFEPENITPVVGPMFPEVGRLLEQAEIPVVGQPLAEYTVDESGGGTGAFVTVAFPVPEEITTVPGLEVVDLPAIPQAAVTVYHGPVAGIGEAWKTLMDEVTAEGHAFAGPSREVYLTDPSIPEEDWDTQLIQPIALR